MNPFVIQKLPRIYFGSEKFAQLSRLAVESGRKVLLITGASSFCSSIYFKDLTDKLNAHSIRYDHVSINGEPSPETVDQIVCAHRDGKPGLIISIGGGSVIDTGKAVSAMILKNNPVENYLEGFEPIKAHDGVKVPFIAVPTTAGTGSEASKNAVLSHVGPDGFKSSLRHDNFVPDIAIVDPDLTVSCPPPVTAACGMDAFVQLLESYVSTRSNELTDAIAVSGLEQARDGLIASFLDGKNIENRSRMAYAALLSGITLAAAGLGIVHGFASVLGALFDIPHGVICGTLIGAATRINIQCLKKQNKNSIFLEKYAKIGALISRRQYIEQDMETNFKLLTDTIDEWINTLEIPRLGKFGVSRGDIDKITLRTANKNNPVKLSQDQIKEIISDRI